MPKKSEEPQPDDDALVDVVRIPWRDEVFTVPKDMDDWDTDACIAVHQASITNSLERLREAMELALGPEQFAKLKATGYSRGALRDFATEFGRIVNEECIS